MCAHLIRYQDDPSNVFNLNLTPNDRANRTKIRKWIGEVYGEHVSSFWLRSTVGTKSLYFEPQSTVSDSFLAARQYFNLTDEVTLDVIWTKRRRVKANKKEIIPTEEGIKQEMKAEQAEVKLEIKIEEEH